MRCGLVLGLFAASMVPYTLAYAQDSTGQSQSHQTKEPSASSKSLRFPAFDQPDRRTSHDPQNPFQSHAAIPLTSGGADNITRLTLPYLAKRGIHTNGPDDATLFNLSVLNHPWDRLSFGEPVLSAADTDGSIADQWGLGPTTELWAQSSPGLTGAFDQDILTVESDDTRTDFSISTLQRVLSYGLGNGWSVGASDMTFAYDWDLRTFTSLPVGIRISKQTTISGKPVHWQLSYERNYYDTGTGPKDTLGFSAKWFAPK